MGTRETLLSCGMIKSDSHSNWSTDTRMRRVYRPGEDNQETFKDFSVGEDRIVTIDSKCINEYKIYCFASLNYLLLTNRECYFYPGCQKKHYSNKCNIPKGEKLKKLSFCVGTNTVYFLTENQTLFELNFGESGDIRKCKYFEGLIIKDIECGNSHMLLLDSCNKVYSFGIGSRGQLGHGDLDDSEIPKIIDALNDKNVIHISCGGWHSLCICDDGELYSWGWNDCGQLGLGCSRCSKGTYRSKKGSSSTSRSDNYIPLTTSPLTDHSNANKDILELPDQLQPNHKPESFKSDPTIPIGDQQILADQDQDEVLSIHALPRLVKCLSNSSYVRVVSIKCGQRHSLVMDDNSWVWGFGLNKHSQLGSGRLPGIVSSPSDCNITTPTPILKHVINMQATSLNSVFLVQHPIT